MPGVPLLDYADHQSHYAEPYIETDGRPGFYAGGTLERGQLVRVRALYYDNRTDPNSRNGGQWGWHTRFTSLAAQAHLPFDFGLIVQWLSGDTVTWDVPAWGRHRHGLSHGFVELTRAFANQRVTVRYDAFATDDRDTIPMDPNGETGHAWTASYQWQFSPQWLVSVEQLWTQGHRTARTLTGPIRTTTTA
jgi:hypothetical protein